ncbi:MAG TPA: hypothetical protein VJR27_05950 [Candidatus Saccharimonadales bacterium]|nr:hypothetical protein [Candidatus Saccharimonadales bacterium]
MNGKRLVTRPILEAMLLAMRRPSDEMDTWRDKRSEIAISCDPKSIGNTAELLEELDKLRRLLEKVREHNVGLTTHKEKLEQDLAASIAERDRLRDQIRNAEHATADQRDRANQLQAALRTAEQLIAELQGKLRLVDAERDYGDQQYEQLAERIGSLEQTHASVDGFIGDLFRRIEHEQKGRQELEAQIANIVPLLTYYQGVALQEADDRPQPSTPAPEFPKPGATGNSPKTMTWPVPERDLVAGKKLKITAKYAWYCGICRRGGDATYWRQCPECDQSVRTNHSVPLTTNVPENPRYGMSLILPEAGNSDNPNLPASDLWVQLVSPD